MTCPNILTAEDFYAELDKEKIENLIIDIIGIGKKIRYIIKHKNKEAFHVDSLLFLDIICENDEKIAAVMKYMKKASSIKHFKNEIFMYKSVIHRLSKEVQSIFPKVMYASPKSDSYDMVIVFEDLTQNGFKMSPGMVKMDISEIKISLKTLGKFHAEMYKMKLRMPDVFTEATTFININNAHVIKNNDAFSLYLHNFMQQVVAKTFERLMRNNRENDKIRACYNLIQKTGLKEMWLNALQPEEPIAVICHGDYNRNNLMFRYEEGVPIECKVIDLQTPCYGSPSIDIGFILFMNMESSDRLKHWTSLWRDYYDALQESLQMMGEDFVIPSFLSLESLQNDFKCKCFYIFLISIYFTPVAFCDMNAHFKRIGEYFAIDEVDEEAKMKSICRSLEIMETQEVSRINDELTLEYIEFHSALKFS